MRESSSRLGLGRRLPETALAELPLTVSCRAVRSEGSDVSESDSSSDLGDALEEVRQLCFLLRAGSSVAVFAAFTNLTLSTLKKKTLSTFIKKSE